MLLAGTAFAVGVLAGAVIVVAARRGRTRTGPAAPLPTAVPGPAPAVVARLDQALAAARAWESDARRLEAREAVAKAAVRRWARAASYWYTIARRHEDVLAALGRHVAEGGSVADEVPRG